MRIIIEKNSVVLNVIEAEDVAAAQALYPDASCFDADGISVGPGWLSDGNGGYVAPAATFFRPLKRWQFKAMVAYLDKAGAIEAAIDQIADPLERAVTRARYLESDLYNRDDPLFDALTPAVGLTSQQIDDAWLTIVGQ